MPWRGRKKWWRLQLRRLCASAALVAYLTAVIGVPLPRTLDKDLSQPFPCQDHVCGCRSAEACWHHCCCFSQEQKQAWAQAHHIELPAPPERPTSQGWQTVRLRDQEKPAGGCCGQHAAAASCCSAPAQSPAKSAPRPSGRPWMFAMKALQCQGLSTLWVHGGIVLPPPPSATWNVYLSPAGWLAVADLMPPSLSLPPLDPPPRWACA